VTPRQYLDKRKESRVLAIRQFHEHLDGCEQCREHPLALCLEGHRALLACMGIAPPSGSYVQPSLEV
jgi:hypothetical protein